MQLSWYGIPSDGQGYSGTSQEYITHLVRAGVDVRVKSMIDNPKARYMHTKDMAEIFEKPFVEADIAIAHGIPSQFGPMFENDHKFRIGFTMFETNQVPTTEEWGGPGGAIKTLNKLDAVFTPSQFAKDLFKQSGVKVPIYVIHNGVNLERFPLIKRPKRKTFTFLMLGTLIGRKNPGAVISAFISLFANKEDVTLVLKTQSGTLGALEFPYKNLIVVDKLSTHQEILGFFRQADIFVFPSRGEGFGLPPLEAMATGIPAIMPSHTGMAEFANEEYCYLIGNGELVKAERFPTKWGDVGQYYEPSYEDLKFWMQHAYENRDDVHLRGQLASKAIRKEFNYEKIAGDIIKALEEIAYGRKATNPKQYRRPNTDGLKQLHGRRITSNLSAES